MSIITKTGDNGTTGLMYNRRVSKCDPRVQAYGAVDELNAALGLARATAADDSARQVLLSIQHNLVILMGELATAVEDVPRYIKDGYSLVNPGLTANLEAQARKIEAQLPKTTEWVMPGATLHSAALDMARTTCRRAEVAVCALKEINQLPNLEVLVFLNRLSDLLWLLARQAEVNGGGSR